MNTGTLSRPSSPALAQRSSTASSMASPTNTTARTPGRRRLAARFRQHLADLGIAALAIDPAHQPGELADVGDPSRRAAFIEAAIVDQPHVETADDAASRNMSACSAQAMSQVGCRLIVASSANISLPLAPARCGDIARALATKAAMSSAADGRASGNGAGLARFGVFAPARRRRKISVWWVRRP